MADTNTNQPAGVTADQTANAQKPGAGADASEQSRSKAWEAAEQHKREAADAKKQAAELQSKLDAIAKEKLVADGNFQKLAADAEERAKAAELKWQSAEKRRALQAAAQEHGLRNLKYLNLVDESKLSFDGDMVVGAAEAVAALKQEDPTLFGELNPKPNNIKTTTATAVGSSPEQFRDTYTADEIRAMSPEQFRGWQAHKRSKSGVGGSRL